MEIFDLETTQWPVAHVFVATDGNSRNCLHEGWALTTGDPNVALDIEYRIPLSQCLASLRLTPDQARGLGQALLEAAEKVLGRPPPAFGEHPRY